MQFSRLWTLCRYVALCGRRTTERGVVDRQTKMQMVNYRAYEMNAIISALYWSARP